MSELRSALGRIIKTFRKARRLSQDELALRAGVDRGYLGAIESGQANPTVDKLDAIGEALGVRFGSLIASAAGVPGALDLSQADAEAAVPAIPAHRRSSAPRVSPDGALAN